jgi:hypothetical protein
MDYSLIREDYHRKENTSKEISINIMREKVVNLSSLFKTLLGLLE